MSEIHFKIAVNKDNRLKNKYKEFCQTFRIPYPTNFEQEKFGLLDLRNHILEGLSFACGFYQGNYRRGQEFIGSNLLVLDVDRLMTLEEAKANPLISENAAMIYTTYNHSELNHKFRVVFLTETELNKEQYYRAIHNLHSRFERGVIDSTCTDFARNFYGNTNAEFHLFQEKYISGDLLAELLEPIPGEQIQGLELSSSDPSTRIPKVIQPKERIEYPDQVLERIRHALASIPDKSLDDGRHDIYYRLVKALQSVFDTDVILKLLEPKIQATSTFNIRECLTDRYTINLGIVFSIAKENGWSLRKFFEDRSKKEWEDRKLPVPACTTTVIDHRYLNQFENWELIDSKTVIIHSSHGTGKTDFVMNQLRDRQFIYVTHREELARDISSRLDNSGIQNIFYKEMDSNDYRLVSESLVICIDSLYKLELSNFQSPTIVIDEFDQFVSHIHGKTCKENRILIFSSLLQLINRSSKNYFLSADFPTVSLDFITKVLQQKSYEYVFNTFIPNPDRELFLHQTEESILQHAFQKYREGHKISIASFSKRKALAYEKRFIAEFGEEIKSKILCIVQETKNMEAQRELLSDKSLVSNYSVLIYSPVLSSGVDFNYPYSDYNYLLANSGRTLDHLEGVQFASRFRNFKELHLFIVSSKTVDSANQFVSFETNRKQGVLHEYRNYYRNHHLTSKLRDSKIRISAKLKKDCASFIMNSFRVRKYKLLMYQNLYPNLVNSFLYRGYNVQYFPNTEVDISLPETLPLNSSNKSVKEMLGISEIEECEQIFYAETISEVVYNGILRDGPRTAEEYCTRISYEIKREIGYIQGDSESEADFKETVYSKISIDLLSKKMSDFKLLYFGKSYARSKDDRAFSRKMIQDYDFYELRQGLLENLFRLIPKKVWFKKDDLSDLQTYVNSNSDKISRNLFKITPIYLKEPMWIVSSLLTLLDLKTVKKQVTKKKIQVYMIDERKLEVLKKRCERLRKLDPEFIYFYKSENLLEDKTPENII